MSAIATLPVSETRAIENATPPLGMWWHLVIFLAAGCVIALRRPDAILHARFYAEDGAIWYATAYNFGWWRVLFSPYEGYLHLVPRLTGGLALLFPLTYAPLVENLVAIAIEALPVNLLLSRRSSGWGPLRFRLALAALYLCLPNAQEVIATVTKSQFLLALSVFLIIFAKPPESKAGRFFDVLFVSLCSLTGPFSIFLAPVALYRWWRTSTGKAISLVLMAGAAIQCLSLVLNTAHRYHPPLGAGVGAFLKILVGEIYLGVLIGPNGFGTNWPLIAVACIAVGVSVVLVWCYRAAPVAMRAMVVMSMMLLAASLLSPVAFPGRYGTAWELLAHAPGMRYWFFPCLAFSWLMAYGLRSSRQVLQLVCGYLLVLTLVGVGRDFRYASQPDPQFGAHARAFEAAPAGSVVVIPTAQDWRLVLTKH